MNFVYPSFAHISKCVALPFACILSAGMLPAAQAQTPFPLGVYVGNPDNSNASNEAAFEADYNSFSALMGTPPQFLVGYINEGDPISHWHAQQSWNASSQAQSPAKNAIPVIGFPMASTASGSATPDQQYQAFANGTYDSEIDAIVQQWQQNGFTTVYWRIGWEMNLSGTHGGYAGTDTATEADWVAAFKRIASDLRASSSKYGITAKIVWNPNITNYDNTSTLSNLYPGDGSVDIIGADIYADMYPYSANGDNSSTWDFDKNAVVPITQFITDPVDRVHYWNYPAATEYSTDGSSGHNLSLSVLLAFAKTHGKPFALPETGAGNSNGGHDVSDESTFPTWLAQTLQSSGNTIAFVDPWYSNADGNYRFSSADANKSGEAMAWAQSFGATSGTAISTTAWYTLINANSKSCIDASGWGTTNGTNLIQYTCGTQQYNQEWQFAPTDSGYYRIVNRNAPAEEIDVLQGGTADKTPLQLWQNYGYNNQQWMPVSLGGGLYKFVSRSSNTCLDVPNASTGTVQLQIFTCNGTGAQAFQLAVQP